MRDPCLLQIATPIAADETYGELQLRLSELGTQALVEALALVELGAATESPAGRRRRHIRAQGGARRRRESTGRSPRISSRGRCAPMTPDPARRRSARRERSSSSAPRLSRERTRGHTSRCGRGQAPCCAIDEAGCTVACGERRGAHCTGSARGTIPHDGRPSGLAAAAFVSATGSGRDIATGRSRGHEQTTSSLGQTSSHLRAAVMRALGPRGAVHLRANAASGRRLFDLATELAHYQDGDWRVARRQ